MRDAFVSVSRGVCDPVSRMTNIPGLLILVSQSLPLLRSALLLLCCCCSAASLSCRCVGCVPRFAQRIESELASVTSYVPAALLHELQRSLSVLLHMTPAALSCAAVVSRTPRVPVRAQALHHAEPLRRTLSDACSLNANAMVSEAITQRDRQCGRQHRYRERGDGSAVAAVSSAVPLSGCVLRPTAAKRRGRSGAAREASRALVGVLGGGRRASPLPLVGWLFFRSVCVLTPSLPALPSGKEPT